MKETCSCQMLIDAGYDAGLEVGLPMLSQKVVLFPDEGEYIRVIRNISGPESRRMVRDVVPDEAFLHMYACEMLERMREWEISDKPQPSDLLVFPFWPGCLASAAGLVVHSMNEVAALFPRVTRVFYVRRPRKVIATEAQRVLGEVCFDPHLYLEEAEQLANRKGWKVLDPM